MTLLFDLDGTLTDSKPGILNSIRYALNKMRHPIPDEETLNRFVGPPLLDSFQRYCGMSHDVATVTLAHYREYFADKGMFENSVYNGIPEALSRLTELGFRNAVATAKPEVFSRKIIEHFQLANYFVAIHGATLDESRNNKQGVVAWALTHSGELGGAIMIGDRLQDIEGAHANGIKCIGVRWGYGNEEELSAADYVVSTPEELVEFLKQPTNLNY